jgi:3-deoxy-D-manno-octulosonic acid kinase
VPVLRQEIPGLTGRGAIVVNPAGNCEPTAPWFEPRYWIARGAVIGDARRSGNSHVFEQEGRRFVLRHYQHAGLMAQLARDRFWWLGEAASRPMREMRVNFEMHAAGLPVPLPVAVRYQRDGLCYRGDIITECLADTMSLAQRLDADDVSFTTWAEIGRCLRRFHDYGFCHANLTAHKIQLRSDQEIYLVDFDRGSRRRQGLWCDANLVTLRRSLESLDARRPAQRFDEAQWHCLLSAYL